MSDPADSETPTPAWDQEQTRAIPWNDPGEQWFFLTEDDQQEGPFPTFALQQQVEAGRLQRETYVWKKGMADWRPVGELSELAMLWQAPEAKTVTEPSPLRVPEAVAAVGPLPPALAAQPVPKDLGSFLFADISTTREHEPPTEVTSPGGPAPGKARRDDATRIVPVRPVHKPAWAGAAIAWITPAGAPMPAWMWGAAVGAFLCALLAVILVGG